MPEPKSLQRLLPNVLLFLALAAALLVAGWGAIDAFNLEVGDFAANSLLIQDAKQLKLLYGNYSRVGFNHPGPAILYVLAAGELVFHDVLHLVPSPLSGQLAAVCLYNAAWITLIFAMLRRLTGALAPAALFVGVAVLTAAYSDYMVFTGMWFPHLYFFPFAAMLVAISRLVYGHTDMLRALAVSCGFLINGHASFIPMLGLMLIVVLAANWLVTRRDPERRLLSRAFICRNRRALLVASGILFLFFVPLLIATVIDFPGPLYQYIKFGRGSKGNTFGQAVRFVAFYWGQGAGMAWGLMLLVLLVKGVRGPRQDFVLAARSLGVAFVAATVALLYYAKKGIDQLDQTYIGLFYFAVPVLAAAVVALYLYEAARWRHKAVAAWALAGLAVVLAWPLMKTAPQYDYNYNRPTVVQLYQELKRLPGPGRVVLDLEQGTKGWDEIWGNTLALQAYARRRGDDMVCVNAGWHISNTRAGKCRQDELGTGKRYFVRRAGEPDPVRGDADLIAMGLALHRLGGTPAAGSYVRVKDSPKLFAGLLGEGWAEVEGEFVWTIGPVARITLPADPKRGNEVMLDLGSYMPTQQARQTVQAFVNGEPAGSYEFNAFEQRRQVKLVLRPDGGAEQRIELRIAKPMSPQEYGHGGDTRKLGLSLYAIRIKEPA